MSQHEHFLNVSLQLWPFSFKCLSIINFKSYKERKLFHETIFPLKSLTDDVSKNAKKKSPWSEEDENPLQPLFIITSEGILQELFVFQQPVIPDRKNYRTVSLTDSIPYHSYDHLQSSWLNQEHARWTWTEQALLHSTCALPHKSYRKLPYTRESLRLMKPTS